MKTTSKAQAALAAAILMAASSTLAQEMSFFVTSAGSGEGGNLGGLVGADARCLALAAVAGAGNKTWRAYLSTQGPGSVNARDRIGAGPWYNANGEMIAENVEQLHEEEENNITFATALDEHGRPVPYVSIGADGNPLPLALQMLVEHDVLTGSQPDGTAFPAGEDRTCRNWTSSDEGSAMLGHHDRRGLQPGLSPWAAAHPSQGCSQQSLVDTGGAGRYYCFAID